MSQSTLSVRVDSMDKQYFEDFCKATGLNVSVAINIFIKSVIRKQRIPFEIEGDPFYSTDNIARIRKAIDEVEAGHYTVHEPLEVD